MRRFTNRFDAGKLLAMAIDPSSLDHPVVLGLPRGGIPVAFEIARALGAPLKALVVRKVGVPGHEELSMGAIGQGGELIRNESIIGQLAIDDETVQTAIERERIVLSHLQTELGIRGALDIAGRDAVIVDDGLATGASMRVAVAVARLSEPSRIVVAVPVAPPEVAESLAGNVDQIVCLIEPEPFIAVGYWYRDFEQTSTEEVRALLETTSQSRHEQG